MNFRPLLLLPLMLYACRQSSTGQVPATREENRSRLNKQGKTIEERFSPPKGYRRAAVGDRSFGTYLRSLPLKNDGAPVLYYNGAEKPNDNIYAAVVNMDIGRQNLQQCADAVMRLRAEYFYNSGQPERIHFNFTNGFNATYSRWMAGDRIAVSGNKVSWVSRGAAGNTYASFRQYMELMFSYAGTLSLSRELRSVEYKDLSIGDVLIQGGSPGHAVIVIDVAENPAGKKMYLLAQSYMPAQETQILQNPMDKGISPWYELDTTAGLIETPQWKFSSRDLKRFAE